VPRLGSRITLRFHWRRDAVFRTAIAVGALLIFGLFFFWSRTLLPPK